MEEVPLPGLLTDAKIGRVWMSRPEARNALNFQIMEDIEAAFAFLQKQFQIPVVIFGGRRGPTSDPFPYRFCKHGL